MKRVMIIGNNGSGKSTFAARLSKRLNLPLIHLDKYFYKGNWVPVTKEEWDKIHYDFIKKDSWIIDGLYPRTMNLRMERADTIIFLDTPKWITFPRIIKRSISDRNKVRVDLGDNKDHLSWIFLKKHTLFPRGKIHKKINEFKKEKQIIILKNSRDIENFFNNL